MQPIDGRTLQAVAVAQALGDEMDDVPAEQLERAAQDHGRRDAVDVVVAVDRDPLVLRQRPLDRWTARSMSASLERIVQVIDDGLRNRGALAGRPARAGTAGAR